MHRSWFASTVPDMRRVLWFSWVAVACIGGLLVSAPYLLAQSLIQEWVGNCARGTGDASPLCGMTTAFYLIARGHFDAATSVNSASVPLYSGLVFTCAAGLLEAAKRWRQSRRASRS